MNNIAIAGGTSHNRHMTMILGMAQLAPRGISEDWWLKYLGDVHWQIIASAVGQNTTVFRDKHGRQLYAAFCATEFSQTQPDLVGLGQNIEIQSDLWAAGRSCIQSNHRLLVNGSEVAHFRLVSTFVTHMTTGVNASVRRATPYLIPVLDPAPDDFAQCASGLSKHQKRAMPADMNQASLPTLMGADFNAVGLLYFPSFTRLLEQTEIAVSDDFNWSPVKHRRVLYFGNIDAREMVTGGVSRNAPNCFELWRKCPQRMHNSILASCSLERF